MFELGVGPRFRVHCMSANVAFLHRHISAVKSQSPGCAGPRDGVGLGLVEGQPCSSALSVQSFSPSHTHFLLMHKSSALQ